MRTVFFVALAAVTAAATLVVPPLGLIVGFVAILALAARPTVLVPVTDEARTHA